MNEDELKVLEKKILILKWLNIFFTVVNLLLIVFPIFHYLEHEFNIDLYFLIVTLLNVIGFYASYKIIDKLNFLKRRYEHFSTK